MWNPFKRKETRQTLEEILIQGGALVKDVTKQQVLSIPAVTACVDIICNTIASLPILLYSENEGTVTPLTDKRVSILNDDTQDTLDGFQFKRAMIEDFLLQGASYAYINRVRNTVRSIHYVDESYVNVNKNTDPIKKRYEIQINGMPYRDFEFIKMTRKSKDGVTGKGIISENNKMFSVAYNTMIFEETMVKTGGNKKGFLKSEGRLSKEAIAELKTAWNNLYANNTENVVILNNGLDFKEASNNSVELQLDQHKNTNSEEICKIFLVPSRVLTGQANDQEYNNWIKICILPILAAFQCALNKDMLLPSEKEQMYFAFDTNELLKGDIEKRFKAYEIATKNGILQIDEIRFRENYPPLGLNFVKLGLQDVLYNPETKEIYTPNTNATANMNNPGASPKNDAASKVVNL